MLRLLIKAMSAIYWRLQGTARWVTSEAQRGVALHW